MTFSVYFGDRILCSGLTYYEDSTYCIYHSDDYPEGLSIWPDDGVSND